MHEAAVKDKGRQICEKTQRSEAEYIIWVRRISELSYVMKQTDYAMINSRTLYTETYRCAYCEVSPSAGLENEIETYARCRTNMPTSEGMLTRILRYAGH